MLQAWFVVVTVGVAVSVGPILDYVAEDRNWHALIDRFASFMANPRVALACVITSIALLLVLM